MISRLNTLPWRQARHAFLLPLLSLAAAAFLASPAGATTTINHQFTSATINPGDISTYAITVTNDDTGSALTNAVVTVVLPSQIMVAAPLTVTANTCDFTVNQPLAAGGSTVELVGGTIAAGAPGIPTQCTFELNVTATAPGNWTAIIPANAAPSATNSGYQATTNGTGVVVTNTTEADATLSVNTLNPLTGNKSFSPTSAYAGNLVTLTITLSNPNAGADVPLMAASAPQPTTNRSRSPAARSARAAAAC